jgi:superfamily II DNA/RNA helicase
LKKRVILARLRDISSTFSTYTKTNKKDINTMTQKTFADLGLSSQLVEALSKEGYVHPTDVQAHAIPSAIAGRDLLVSAQTGSGKTAAFLLPSLMKLAEPAAVRGSGPRVLVLTPTRELAMQVEKNAQNYGKNLKYLNTACLVGGSPMGFQLRQLSKPVDVVIATPGRLIDHLERGRLDFSRLEVLILDEADRMLDMGFIDDIEKIVAATPKNRQTLLFSATLDGTVGRLAARLTTDPERIEIARKEEKVTIEEHVLFTDDFRHKNRLLDHLMGSLNYDQMVIFTATKISSEELADRLYESGINAACLHGDMPQAWRNRTLNDLRMGRIKVLVATDVAARGIDVPTITHVINFDLPKQAEDYVHRIGRTGRAGREGVALTFCEVRDFHKIRRVEQYINRSIPEMRIAGFEATRAVPKGGSGKPSTGKRYGGGGGYAGKRSSNAASGGSDRPSSAPRSSAPRSESSSRTEGARADGRRAPASAGRPQGGAGGNGGSRRPR